MELCWRKLAIFRAQLIISIDRECVQCIYMGVCVWRIETFCHLHGMSIKWNFIRGQCRWRMRREGSWECIFFLVKICRPGIHTHTPIGFGCWFYYLVWHWFDYDTFCSVFYAKSVEKHIEHGTATQSHQTINETILRDKRSKITEHSSQTKPNGAIKLGCSTDILVQRNSNEIPSTISHHRKYVYTIFYFKVFTIILCKNLDTFENIHTARV